MNTAIDWCVIEFPIKICICIDSLAFSASLIGQLELVDSLLNIQLFNLHYQLVFKLH